MTLKNLENKPLELPPAAGGRGAPVATCPLHVEVPGQPSRRRVQDVAACPPRVRYGQVQDVQGKRRADSLLLLHDPLPQLAVVPTRSTAL